MEKENLNKILENKALKIFLIAFFIIKLQNSWIHCKLSTIKNYLRFSFPNHLIIFPLFLLCSLARSETCPYKYVWNRKSSWNCMRLFKAFCVHIGTINNAVFPLAQFSRHCFIFYQRRKWSISLPSIHMRLHSHCTRKK